jgi:hypothetical protein
VRTYYETKQRILEEAGLVHSVRDEVPSGLVNGSNKVFTVAHKPLADRNYDDTIDGYDVTFYVNGSTVAVAGIDETDGEITLLSAPANGAEVTVDYNYAVVADQVVCDARDEAHDFVDEYMDGTDSVPYSTVPATIRKITRFYAAGLLLARDYGSGADIENTSKDGYLKMDKAEAWLAKYVEIGGMNGLSLSGADVEVESDANLFTTYDRESGRYVRPDGRGYSVDESFMLNLDDN